jgi:hypothetical protein
LIDIESCVKSITEQSRAEQGRAGQSREAVVPAEPLKGWRSVTAETAEVKGKVRTVY